MGKKRAGSPPNPLHPDLLGLLASCRAAPADDTPRLVLADWLDEFADVSGLPSPDDARARAELLRVQVELARPSCDAARIAELRAAERALLTGHAERWVGDLHRRFHQLSGARTAYTFEPLHQGYWWSFARGLLTVRLQPHLLDDRGLGDWFRSPQAAWTEEATVAVGGAAALDALTVTDAVRPYLGVQLRLGGRVNGNRVERLPAARCRRILSWPSFLLVRGLTLSGAAVDGPFLGLLAGADVSNVRWLTLTEPLDDTAAGHLGAVPLSNLSGLVVARTELSAVGLRLIVRNPHLRQLAHLSAYRNPVGCDGAVALAESPLAQTLRVLELQNTGIADRGTAALAASPLFHRLYGPGLNLSLNPIGDAGARALAGCDGLNRFTELILRECQIGDAGARALAESPHVAGLAYLDLFKNRVGDTGAAALAGSQVLGNVRDLSLRDNAITASGAESLRAVYGDRAKV